MGSKPYTLYHRRIRMKVLTHYGGIPPKCSCCGEDHIEFLCIDHIDGSGGRDRTRHTSTYKVYRDIIHGGFPDNLRVLCHNCNQAYGYLGYCPHQEGAPEYLPDHLISASKPGPKPRSKETERKRILDWINDPENSPKPWL